MIDKLEFVVYGEPIPQGSMKAFMPKNGKFPIVTADNARTRPWRQEIAGAALNAMQSQRYTRCGRGVALIIEATFFFSKPKSAKRSITHKTTKPDLDKLLRSLCDALSGVVYEDDAQVTDAIIRKRFGSPPRMEFSIIEAEPLPPSVPFKHEKIRELPF